MESFSNGYATHTTLSDDLYLSSWRKNKGMKMKPSNLKLGSISSKTKSMSLSDLSMTGKPPLTRSAYVGSTPMQYTERRSSVTESADFTIPMAPSLSQDLKVSIII